MQPTNFNEYIPTPAEIARHYSAMLDSVMVINKISAQAVKSAQDVDTIARNGQHLKYMLTKTFWTTEDMTTVHAAVALSGV